MRLNLQQIMHVPGASIPFAFQLDLSQEAFFGEYPISRPVTVTGHVKNVADVLMLEGEAKSLLDYTCDRCMCRFSREKAVRRMTGSSAPPPPAKIRSGEGSDGSTSRKPPQWA